jgi:rubredoxin
MDAPQFSFLTDFTYTAEANIFKGLLESEGIETFVRDNFTVDANPLWSNAVGGVKLFVKTEDLDKAKHILSHVTQFSVDDLGKPVECPNCHQPKAQLITTVKETKSIFAFLGALLFVGLPLYTKYRYKCANCGFEFSLKK